MPLSIEIPEDDCPHTEVLPYGDGRYGRCTQCGDGSFPFVSEADPEVERRGIVMVLMPERRDELLAKLRERRWRGRG